jgi:CDP-paratose synthetase
MLISKLAKDEKVIDLTLGDRNRIFIYSDDVVNAYKTVLDNIHALKKGYIAIPVGSGSLVSIKDFALIVKNILKSKSELNFGAIDYRINEIFSSNADTSILSKLGWTITSTLNDGIVKVSSKINVI